MAQCNRVIDLYSGETGRDPGVDFQVVKDRGGVVAVIHKATEGGDYQDRMYGQCREAAVRAGLLWGAYHFATGRPVTEQLDNFLGVVRGDYPTVLVLDFEEKSPTNAMTLEQANDFVTRIRDLTGVWPGLYAGRYLRELLAKLPGPYEALAALGNLVNCWFWAARYDSTLTEPPLPAQWASWKLWQYTDGKAGAEPRTVAGVGPCDRNYFNGSDEELLRFWAENSVTIL